MTMFIKIPGVNPPNTRPRIDLIDPILPSAGAMILVDPTNPALKWASGLPVNGATVPNIAEESAQALGMTDYDPIFSHSTNISGVANGIGKVERTGKGGLAGVFTQALGHSSATGVRINHPASMYSYLEANPTNDLYISLWGRITRLGESTMAWSGFATNTSPSATELLYSFPQDSNIYPTGSNRLGFLKEPDASWRSMAQGPSPIFADISVSQYTGTPGALKHGKLWAITMGSGDTRNNPFAGSNSASTPSGIFYRYYMEDLTVSGRTHAAVEALDHSLYTKEVLTPGGRYFGDTFTDPATIP